MGKGYSYGEALALVSELQKDQGSRLHASIAGWKYPMSRSEFYLAGLFAKAINRDRGKDEKPYQLDWPWPDAPTKPDVTDEELADLKAQLRASSAFGQIRTT
jgi:hypothetical protein